MSTSEQFDLFSGNYEFDFGQPSEIESQTKTLEPVKESPKPVAFEMKKSLDYSVLSTIAPGSFIFTGNIHRPEKLVIIENNNGLLKCKKHFEENSPFRREEDEIPFVLDPKNTTLLASVEEDGMYFFTQNLKKPVRKVKSDLFLNYFNKLNDLERQNLLVFRTFFSHWTDTLSDVVKSNNPFLAAYRNAKYTTSYTANIGYWDSNLSIDYNHRSDEWNIDYFGTQYTWPEDSMLLAYKSFIATFRVDDTKELDLSKLSDFHLIAFYAFQGYRVNLDFLTFEWTIKHSASTKPLYIEREELLEPQKVIEKWKQFSTVKNISSPSLSRGAFFNDRFIDKYATTEKFKGFVIPKGTRFYSEQVYNKTGHRDYMVLEDDGKKVRLAPVNIFSNNDTEILSSEPEVIIPRKFVTSVTLVTSDKTSYCSIPYGIPESMENSSEQMFKNIKEFFLNLSERELKQFMVLDVIANNTNIVQSIAEKDIPLAVKMLKERNSYGGSSIVTRATTSVSTKGVTISLLFNSDINPISYSFKELCMTYWEMELAIERFDTSDLTLPELILFYKMKGHRLTLTSQPSFLKLDGLSFHTTKHDPTNYEAMIEFINKSKSVNPLQ